MADVRQYTSKVEELMLVNAQEHRSPVLRFSWSSLSFDCVLEDLVQRFTVFGDDGTPLRAICKVVFKEYATATTQLSNTRRESADHTKRMALREGETLSSLSAREYNDCRKWRVIADANNIDDPENLAAGTVRKTGDFFKPGDVIMPFPKKNNFRLASTGAHFHIELSDGSNFINPFTFRKSDAKFKRTVNGGISWEDVNPTF